MMKLRWLYLLVWAALVSVALTGRAREVCLSGYSGFCSKGITQGAVVDFSGLSLDHDASLAYDRRDSVMWETLRGVAGIRRDYVGPYLFTDRQFDRYLTAEGYITPDSVYHAYIPDYQGNIVGVVNTAARHMDQYTEYYPYGLPFASSVLPDNNRYKFGAKELIPDLGFNASDFEARTLTHAFPAFSQPDPMAEKYHPLSPYIFCANNPINLIDPTGMKFTDGSEKYINRLVSEVDSRIDNINKDIAKNMAKLSEEGITDKKAKSIIKEISKLNAENRTYQEVKDEINVLRKSSQIYNVALDNAINTEGDALGVGKEINGRANYNFDTDMFDVKIGVESLGLLAHELKHAYQFETGQLSTGYYEDGRPFYDKSDEIEAYKRGNLFDGPDFYNLPSTYNKFKDGPLNVVNHRKFICFDPIKLIQVANVELCAFRWLGITYRASAETIKERVK